MLEKAILKMILVAILMSTNATPEVVPQKPDGNWVCFQADLQNTGWMPQEALDSPEKLKLSWKTETSWTSGKPIIIDEKVYLGSKGGMTCYELKTGEEIWNKKIDRLCRQPVWHDGKIYTNS